MKNHVVKYRFEDYKGTSINHWVVVSVSDEISSKGEKQWIFRCVCGKEVPLPPSRVIGGHNKSCGCMRYKNVTRKKSTKPTARRTDPKKFLGQTNNRLTVIGYEKPARGRTKLVCSCECGGTTLCFPYQFSSGDVKSCGCLKGGKKGEHDWDTNRKTHGLSKHPFYKKWNDMIRRCYLPKEPAYKFYGARGISVCDDWRDTPEKFVQWCEATHPGEPNLTLDRIDVNGNYSPDNCRWVTQTEQTQNLRNNRKVTINGAEKCVTTWVKEFGLSSGSVYKKVHKGMTFEEAILDAVKKKRRPK